MSQQASPHHHAQSNAVATQNGVRSVPMVGVPLALLRDKRLTPMERNLYLVFLAAAREGSLPPNLEWQRRLLACAETQSLVSPSTAKRCVFLLRLTRWIHQEPQRHDLITGQPLPPAYVIHDAPASCATVCAADPDYADLLRDALCAIRTRRRRPWPPACWPNWRPIRCCRRSCGRSSHTCARLRQAALGMMRAIHRHRHLRQCLQHPTRRHRVRRIGTRHPQVSPYALLPYVRIKKLLKKYVPRRRA
jgi:hypothetical protein